MDNNALLANLSEDYYLHKLSLGELAKKYNLSRYLINKYLDDALKKGIVKIEINSTSSRNAQLETILHDRFDHINFFVIRNNSNETPNALSKSAASIVEKMLKNNCKVVGTGWGESIYNLVDNFQDLSLEYIKFVQFIGENMKYNSAAGSMRMVEKIANKFSGNFLTLPTPLYIINDDARELLHDEPSIKQTLETAQKMDLLLTGVGTIRSLNSVPIWKKNLAHIFPSMNLGQITGFIYGRPFNNEGQILNINHDKVMGLTLDQILRVPRRVCFVRNKSKVQAVLGILNGQLITDIILSENMAYRILAELDY